MNHPPVQQATLEFIPIEEVLPQFGFLCSVDPHNCEVVDLPKHIIKDRNTGITIISKLNNGDQCSSGGSQLNIQLGGISDTTEVRDNNDGSYMAYFVPQQVGEVKLSVFINGEQIKGSPYSVMVVNNYTSVNMPSKIVNNNGNMGNPWGIAFGKNGIWAVTDWSNHCVYIFDCEDQLVEKFGTKGTNKGQFNCPEGVAFDSDDHLYVADSWNHRVQKFYIDGKYLQHFGGKGNENGKLTCPVGLTVCSHQIFVTEYGNKRISVFHSDGAFLHTIGSEQLGTPHDVTINSNNQLLVVDYDHHCIHTFTLDGDYVGKLGTYGTGTGQLNFPYGITVDFCGFIFVADTNNDRVSIYDNDGNYINCFGSKGSTVGQFLCPTGVAVGVNGNLYISDHHNKRIQIFTY